MSEFIKRRVALCKAMEEIIKKLREKGEDCQELKVAFGVIKKELVNPHTKDEVMDALKIVLATMNQNL